MSVNRRSFSIFHYRYDYYHCDVTALAIIFYSYAIRSIRPKPYGAEFTAALKLYRCADTAISAGDYTPINNVINAIIRQRILYAVIRFAIKYSDFFFLLFLSISPVSTSVGVRTLLSFRYRVGKPISRLTRSSPAVVDSGRSETVRFPLVFFFALFT